MEELRFDTEAPRIGGNENVGKQWMNRGLTLRHRESEDMRMWESNG